MSDGAVFKRLKFKANGMLDPLVYAEINRRSATVKADIVEVGTAHGAATIALALGAPEGIRVKTIEKFEGGSRVRYGSIEDNLAIIAENFAHFGVSDRIDLFIGTPQTTLAALEVDEIGLLLIDADGCIDRDFRLYYDMLQPGAPIIIDDYRPRYIGAHYKNGGLFVDQKHRITTLLIDLFELRRPDRAGQDRQRHLFRPQAAARGASRAARGGRR